VGLYRDDLPVVPSYNLHVVAEALQIHVCDGLKAYQPELRVRLVPRCHTPPRCNAAGRQGGAEDRTVADATPGASFDGVSETHLLFRLMRANNYKVTQLSTDSCYNDLSSNASVN